MIRLFLVSLVCILSINANAQTDTTPPVVTISGQEVYPDTDFELGDRVGIDWTATDADGFIQSTSWWFEGSPPNISLRSTERSTSTSRGTYRVPDGASTIFFSATDNSGNTATTSFTFFVQPPGPKISIIGGSRGVNDSDAQPGENVSVSATASDADGTIVSTVWIIDGNEVAAGTTATLALPDGDTAVKFRATDDDGNSTESEVILTVALPMRGAYTTCEPWFVNGSYGSSGSRGAYGVSNFPDVDGVSGGDITLSRKVPDSWWTINGQAYGKGTLGNLTIRLPDGKNAISYMVKPDYNLPCGNYKHQADIWPTLPPLIVSAELADSNGVVFELGGISPTRNVSLSLTDEGNESFINNYYRISGVEHVIAITNPSGTTSLMEGETFPKKIHFTDAGTTTIEITSYRLDLKGERIGTEYHYPDSPQKRPVVTEISFTIQDVPIISLGSLWQSQYKDTDYISGEVVNLNAELSGSVASLSWVVNGELIETQVQSGSRYYTLYDVFLEDGINTISMRAVGFNELTTEKTETVIVEDKRMPPVSIRGRGRTIQGYDEFRSGTVTELKDTDFLVGENASVTANSALAAEFQWYLNGIFVGSGESTQLALDDGINTVRVAATFEDGRTTEFTYPGGITVSAPSELKMEPVIVNAVQYTGDRSFRLDEHYQNVDLSTTDANSSRILLLKLYKCTDSIASSCVATSSGISWNGNGLYRFPATYYGTEWIGFSAWSKTNSNNQSEITVFRRLPVEEPSVDVILDEIYEDTDGLPGEKIVVSPTFGISQINQSVELLLRNTESNPAWVVLCDYLEVDVCFSGGSKTISVNDGENILHLSVLNEAGLYDFTSARFTVAAPASSQAAPVVSISGGDRSISDTDGAAGETVSFTATATDSDGSVASSSWLIGGEVVATGTSANLTLGDGSTTVTFRATDDDGDSTSTSVTITVVAPVIPNVAPVVAIIGGNRSISDTDSTAGETVSFTATATDSDGELASTSWLVGDEVVASGTSATLSLPDGSTTVIFRATDDDGDSTNTSVTVTVAAPVIPNIAPVVSIIGGSRSVSDSDGESGETVALTATASDSDGSIASTSWLVGGEVVATGTSANLSLPDGSTAVTFRATDDDGDSTSTSVTITVAALVIPNIAPVVSIIGGGRTVSDSDGESGETVALTATASDSDGSIASTSWLVGGEVVASGTSATLSLPDGSTTVTFRATDEDGDSTSTSVTIAVAAPVIPNIAPVVSIIGGSRSVSDSDGESGETVALTATASDSDGSIASTSWLVGGEVVATGTSANLSLPDGSTAVTFRATDEDGDSTSTSVTITVAAPDSTSTSVTIAVAAPVIPNIAPVVSIIGGSRSVSDSDGESNGRSDGHCVGF